MRDHVLIIKDFSYLSGKFSISYLIPSATFIKYMTEIFNYLYFFFFRKNFNYLYIYR